MEMTITYACGHIIHRPTSYNEADRGRFLAWADQALCSDCWEQQRAAPAQPPVQIAPKG